MNDLNDDKRHALDARHANEPATISGLRYRRPRRLDLPYDPSKTGHRSLQTRDRPPSSAPGLWIPDSSRILPTAPFSPAQTPFLPNRDLDAMGGFRPRTIDCDVLIKKKTTPASWAFWTFSLTPSTIPQNDAWHLIHALSQAY